MVSSMASPAAHSLQISCQPLYIDQRRRGGLHIPYGSSRPPARRRKKATSQWRRIQKERNRHGKVNTSFQNAYRRFILCADLKSHRAIKNQNRNLFSFSFDSMIFSLRYPCSTPPAVWSILLKNKSYWLLQEPVPLHLKMHAAYAAYVL